MDYGEQFKALNFDLQLLGQSQEDIDLVIAMLKLAFSLSLFFSDIALTVGSVVFNVLTFVTPLPVFLLSILRESTIDSFIGSDILSKVLAVMNYITDYGLILQLVVFGLLIYKQIPLHYYTWNTYTLGQHALNFIQVFLLNIFPSFVEDMVPLLSFKIYAQKNYVNYPKQGLLDSYL